jgi:hypothetical protein
MVINDVCPYMIIITHQHYKTVLFYINLPSGWLVHTELERMRNEVVVASSETLSLHFPGGTDKNHKNLI